MIPPSSLSCWPGWWRGSVGQVFYFYPLHWFTYTYIQNQDFQSKLYLQIHWVAWRIRKGEDFDWFPWIVGNSRCACLLLHFKVAFISFTSCPGSVWNFSYLDLLNWLILDYSYQELILSFGCDELHLTPCAECWCECIHKVLFCVELWALALTALTFFLFFCFDWMDGLLVVLLWLSLSKSFPIFLSELSALWQKALSCKDLRWHSWWHWPGTHIALSAFFTASFFISDDVMIALDVKQAAGVVNLFRQAGRCCQDEITFVQVVVGGLTYLLWSLCLMWWWKCLKGEFPDLTRAFHVRQGPDVDHCRGLHLPSLVSNPDTKTKERGFQPWWLKASALFWFMD